MMLNFWSGKKKAVDTDHNSPLPEAPKPPKMPESALSGRFFRRQGASIQGTLSNWINSLVNNRIAEREKRRVSHRAWDLFTNDAMAHGIIEGLVTEIVGTGMTPIAWPMTRWLNKDPVWQQEYQSKCSDIWEIWGLDPRNWCDAQRRLNIYQLQCLAIFGWKLDGISLFQVVSRNDPFRPLSLSILPIDSGRLVTPSDMLTGSNIFDGVEIGEDGEPVAAWILKPNVYNSQFSMARADECWRIPIINPSTGFPNLLMVCDVRNIAEYRQDSILGSMIKEIRDSNDFVDAALVKSLISNLITLFVQGYYNSDAPPDWADRIKEIEKGTILMGNEGEIPHFFSNDTPGPGYNIMNDSIIGRLGMATGRGPENVAKKYDASYSASQASMENSARVNDSDRMVINNCFNQPIHTMMLYESALRGMLPVDSIKDFQKNLYAYTRAQWLPPKLRPIDKLKAANADRVSLGNATRTYSDIYGEKSQDWRAGVYQWLTELKFTLDTADEIGIAQDIVLGLRGLRVQPLLVDTQEGPPQPTPTKLPGKV